MLFFYVMVDHPFMKRAIMIAEKAAGRTSPNPMVGAVLVKRGRVVSEGFHKKAGTAHAEVVAIDAAGAAARGATLYVSLEPCCHKDKRTPPCTQKIISSGIVKVVVAMTDPNPKVSGKGIAELRAAGIEVVSGVLERKARELNEHYIKYITSGSPFVILKTAMTLDGKTATASGESKWITGEKSRKLVHRLRGRVDAILTAIGTVRADDPRLTCRVRGGRDPMRVVIDPLLETPEGANILHTPPETILVTKGKTYSSERFREKISFFEEKGIKVLALGDDEVDLPALMRTLGTMGVVSVMVEGGASLNSRCLESGIVDKVMFFIAPKIMGGRDSYPAVGGAVCRPLADAHMISDLNVKRIGEDILIEGKILRRGR